MEPKCKFCGKVVNPEDKGVLKNSLTGEFCCADKQCYEDGICPIHKKNQSDNDKALAGLMILAAALNVIPNGKTGRGKQMQIPANITDDELANIGEEWNKFLSKDN